MADIKILISQLENACAKEIYNQIASANMFPSEAKELLANINNALTNINGNNLMSVLQNLKTKYPQLDKIFNQFQIQYQEQEQVANTQRTIKQIT